MKIFAAALGVALIFAACSSSGGSSHGAAGGSVEASSSVPSVRAAARGAPVPSPGCGTSTVRVVDSQRRTMNVAGDTRDYYLTTPPAHDGRTPLPLVLDFHGLGEGAAIHTKMSNFGALANQLGFVVAFPDGPGPLPHWRLSVPPHPNPDLQFVDQLLDTLERQLCIDTSRVYASGLSMGAFMASFVACTRSNRFAAVAPVAGITIYDGCTPKRPVPVLAFHGTTDPILRFNGGVGAIPGITPPTAPGTPTTTLPTADLNGGGYPATVAAWAKRNGCDPTPTDTKLTKEVIHRVYKCPAGADVEFYIVIGGGHAWPGSAFSRSIKSFVGYTTMDVNATNLIWDFFKRFQLPAS